MRFGAIIAAAAAMLLAGQANAEIFNVNVSGFVTGTQITFGCDGQAYCFEPSPYSGFVSTGISPLRVDLQEGANSFEFGGPYGYFYGTIINNARVLTGVNLTYLTYGCTRGSSPRPGCVDVQNATAPTFLVEGGVPEPATWALMILGMGAVGFAMRRRSTVNTTVRFA